ncbi:MAG: hypothetical protein HQL19_08310, partial [Candidatus Omnitrophica bacterium]|nr:hypothetical protein [Candidatus Omnitrophota bacterium]
LLAAAGGDVPAFQAKLKKRYDFLTDVLPRAKTAQAVFKSVYTNLTAPVDCPVYVFDPAYKTQFEMAGSPFHENPIACAERLIGVLANPAVMDDLMKIDNRVIYGWKTEDKTWHLVQAEAVVPRRCTYGALNTNNFDCCTPANKGKFPWIKTTTSNMGLNRCFTLHDYSGCVRTRVTRYDQSRDSAFTKFANGLNLWMFQFFHPASGDTSLVNDPVQLNKILDSCVLQHTAQDKDANGNVVPYTGPPFPEGAFMINSNEDFTPAANAWASAPARGILCDAGAINELLKHGQASDICAQYKLIEWQDGYKNVTTIINSFVQTISVPNMLNGYEYRFSDCSTCCTGLPPSND